MRICIIDDNAMVLEALTLVLRDRGHEVFVAARASEAMALVAATNPDFVLVDLDLPGKRGDALAGALRGHHPLLPIVLTSGHEAPPARSIGPAAADMFLAKPFTTGALIATFCEIRGRRDEAASP